MSATVKAIVSEAISGVICPSVSFFTFVDLSCPETGTDTRKPNKIPRYTGLILVIKIYFEIKTSLNRFPEKGVQYSDFILRTHLDFYKKNRQKEFSLSITSLSL